MRTISEILRLVGIGFLHLGVYFLIVIAIALTLKLIFKNIPDYVFRKILHFIAFNSAIFIGLTNEWHIGVLICVIFIIILFPLLHFLEGNHKFEKLLVEKKKGEITFSFTLIYFLAGSTIAVLVGILNRFDIFVLCILMWGWGDAFAALVGKRFGKHHFTQERISKKTYEGTFAMFLFSFGIGIIAKYLFQFSAISISNIVISAVLATIVELYSSSLLDTVTVPVSIAVVLLLLSL